MIWRRFIALALVVAMGTADAANYLDLRTQAPIHGAVAAGAAKAEVCVGCHGPNGNSLVPMFPRLAGQRVNYLYWRLVTFKGDDPGSSPMPAIVKDLADADLRNLAAYFAAQIPAVVAGAPPAQDGASTSSDNGEDLYLHGDPTRGIPPCQGCHGADAAGPTLRTGQYAAYPSLRAQQATYVASRLTQFKNGIPQRTSNDFIMHSVAQTLDDQSIQALAGWLGALPLAR